MKISELEAKHEAKARLPKRPTDRDIVIRAVLVVGLTFGLVVSLRWAVEVTNANARRVSTNLVSWRSEPKAQPAPKGEVAKKRVALSKKREAEEVPILSP